MTVKELKEELNKVNDSANVYFFAYDMNYALGEFSTVEISKEGDIILHE